VKLVIFANSNRAEGGNYTVPPWKHVNEGDYHLLEQDNYELVTEKHRIRPGGYYGSPRRTAKHSAATTM